MDGCNKESSVDDSKVTLVVVAVDCGALGVTDAVDDGGCLTWESSGKKLAKVDSGTTELELTETAPASVV